MSESGFKSTLSLVVQRHCSSDSPSVAFRQAFDRLASFFETGEAFKPKGNPNPNPNPNPRGLQTQRQRVPYGRA